MEWLNTLLENSNIPLITAFLLGLLTAVSPCPMATNITAIGFISKDIESRNKIFWNGILYTLGRVFAYTVLGAILIPLLRQGASIFQIEKYISQYGGQILGPALIFIGLFMLFSSKINLPKFGFRGDGESLSGSGSWGALVLGILFALAFCPTSGVFYFGMLIPMSANIDAGLMGYIYPLSFAIATALPVIVVAWILAYSMSNLGKFYTKMQTFQKWFSIIIAILFIVVGAYYCITYFL